MYEGIELSEGRVENHIILVSEARRLIDTLDWRYNNGSPLPDSFCQMIVQMDPSTVIALFNSMANKIEALEHRLLSLEHPET